MNENEFTFGQQEAVFVPTYQLIVPALDEAIVSDIDEESGIRRIKFSFIADIPL